MSEYNAPWYEREMVLSKNPQNCMECVGLYICSVAHKSGKRLPSDCQIKDRAKRGAWKPLPEDVDSGKELVRMYCDCCNNSAIFDKGKNQFILSDYCQHCGAKMDL